MEAGKGVIVDRATKHDDDFREQRAVEARDPHKLVFFEIFSSSAAHKFHLEQDYMKRLFTALEGKLAGAPIMTKLNAL